MTLIPQMKPMNWIIIYMFSNICLILVLLNLFYILKKNHINIKHLKMNNMMMFYYKKW
uniref:ATP synthase F0 subunit 8 n=1 Tax=Phytoseiulus persimilis TaxID=44414 RepID=D5HKV8_PHYPM|nr:ATP synthase F0 subunit 8 [Phytoseiulus persimilis]